MRWPLPRTTSSLCLSPSLSPCHLLRIQISHSAPEQCLLYALFWNLAICNHTWPNCQAIHCQMPSERNCFRQSHNPHEFQRYHFYIFSMHRKWWHIATFEAYITSFHLWFHNVSFLRLNFFSHWHVKVLGSYFIQLNFYLVALNLQQTKYLCHTLLDQWKLDIFFTGVLYWPSSCSHTLFLHLVRCFLQSIILCCIVRGAPLMSSSNCINVVFHRSISLYLKTIRAVCLQQPLSLIAGFSSLDTTMISSLEVPWQIILTHPMFSSKVAGINDGAGM